MMERERERKREREEELDLGVWGMVLSSSPWQLL
jgi:hypothetical protein